MRFSRSQVTQKKKSWENLPGYLTGHSWQMFETCMKGNPGTEEPFKKSRTIRRLGTRNEKGSVPWSCCLYYRKCHCCGSCRIRQIPKPESRPTNTMTKSSVQAMETIHESTHPRPRMTVMSQSGSQAEAALFSVVRPNQLSQTKSGVTMPARSSSLKMPVTRKASYRVREWVKRSSSSR